MTTNHSHVAATENPDDLPVAPSFRQPPDGWSLTALLDMWLMAHGLSSTHFGGYIYDEVAKKTSDFWLHAGLYLEQEGYLVADAVNKRFTGREYPGNFEVYSASFSPTSKLFAYRDDEERG